MKKTGTPFQAQMLVSSQERHQQAQQEVHTELGKRMDEYMNKKWSELEYGGNPMPPLPVWFKDFFKKVILNIIPASNEILAHQLFAIGQTKEEDLLFGNVGLMFSVFNNAAPSCFTDDYDLYIEIRKELDKIMFTWNDLHQKKQEELLESKKFMLSVYNQTTWTKKSNLIAVN